MAKGKVLVVDDEINLCRILDAKLKKNGYQVQTVHDGLQAVERVQANDYDVVLLDLILPKMDGLTALERIRAIDKSLPVIIMTACGNSEAVEHAMSSGANAFLNKPFDLDNLIALIQTTTAADDEETVKEVRGPESDRSLFAKNAQLYLEMDRSKSRGTFESKILSRENDGLHITVPRQNEEPLMLNMDTPLWAGLPANEALYTFNTHIVGLPRDAQDEVIIQIPEVIYRTQRRRHPRLRLEAPATYSVITNGEQERPKLLATLRDISLGGLRLETRQSLTSGDLLFVAADALLGIGDLRGLGKVARVEMGEPKEQPSFTVGIQFTQINDSAAQAIDNYPVASTTQ